MLWEGHKNSSVASPRGLPGGSAVKNPPAVQQPQKMWVRSLGWEDILEESMATHASILDRGAWQATIHRTIESDTTEAT